MTFFHVTKKAKQKFKYLENEKSFQGEIKRFLIIFKGMPVTEYCLKPEGAP